VPANAISAVSTARRKVGRKDDRDPVVAATLTQFHR
jgi:hypothetical protein